MPPARPGDTRRRVSKFVLFTLCSVPLARLVALKDGLVLYVRDEMLWQKHASRILPATNGSALYSIPKDILFPTLMPHTTKPVSSSPVQKQRQQEKTP